MNNPKPKILITTGIYPPEIGGPATYTALLEKEMPRHGIEVSVLPFRTVRHLPRWLRHFVFLLKVLKKGRQADLLYSQDPLSVGFPTMLAAKILGKPFLVRIAGDYAWEQSTQRFGVKEGIDEFQGGKYGLQTELMKWLQKTTASLADKVICPSKYFANLVSNWQPEKIKALPIYNGIDFSDIPQSRGQFESKTIISAGRLVSWKGFDTLIELLKELPDWKLFIAGDGPDKEKLSGLIKSLNLNERVFLLGKMERADLIRKMQQCEIFILNTSFESFSFQIVEAMFAGVPVISTDIGNIAEIVDNGENGLLVAPNDKAEILKAIRKFEDHSFRQKTVVAAQEKAKLFSIEKTIARTSEVMFSFITGRKKGIFKNNILLRYLVAGVTGASTQIGLLYVLTELAGLWYIHSSLLAFAAAVAVSFMLQKFWTFADNGTKNIHHQFARYMLVAILGVAINTVLMYLLVDIIHFWYVFSQVIIAGLIALFNFAMYRAFIFKRSPIK